MTENPGADPIGPQPQDADEEPDEAGGTGYAVYDLTLRRFVGRVHGSKRKATSAGPKVDGHEYETRPV